MTDIRDAEPHPPDDSPGYCCVMAGMHMGHDEDCPEKVAETHLDLIQDAITKLLEHPREYYKMNAMLAKRRADDEVF